jgi:hypothetical protein
VLNTVQKKIPLLISAFFMFFFLSGFYLNFASKSTKPAIFHPACFQKRNVCVCIFFSGHLSYKISIADPHHIDAEPDRALNFQIKV